MKAFYYLYIPTHSKDSRLQVEIIFKKGQFAQNSVNNVSSSCAFKFWRSTSYMYSHSTSQPHRPTLAAWPEPLTHILHIHSPHAAMSYCCAVYPIHIVVFWNPQDGVSKHHTRKVVIDITKTCGSRCLKLYFINLAFWNTTADDTPRPMKTRRNPTSGISKFHFWRFKSSPVCRPWCNAMQWCFETPWCFETLTGDSSNSFIQHELWCFETLWWFETPYVFWNSTNRQSWFKTPIFVIWVGLKLHCSYLAFWNTTDTQTHVETLLLGFETPLLVKYGDSNHQLFTVDPCVWFFGSASSRLPSTNRLIVLPFKLSTISSRTFNVIAAARTWNGLPEDVTSSPTLPAFCKRLKTYLFSQSYPSWHCSLT